MNIAIIFAGGVGSRMRTKGAPKQFLNLFGKPIIVHTVEKFEYNSSIDKIVIVMLEEYISFMNQLVKKYGLTKVARVVVGGKTGQESIYNGLKAANEISHDAIVLIHDGVRPIIENGLIEKNISSVKQYGSAISSVPCKETIIKISDLNAISEVVDRNTVWIARAPQSFYLKDILNAHEKAIMNNQTNVIDSCTLMSNYGFPCHYVETLSENIKITTPDDYYLAKAIIESQVNKEVLGIDSTSCS